MENANTPGPGWGPQRKRGAVSLSFDNLGEAAAINRGDVIAAEDFGHHPTAAFFPEFLGMVGDMPATWFIEASNALVYPDIIRAWAGAGKEVGIHAWQHESWGKLDASQRQDILRRSVDAFTDLGIRPQGFRPPGGATPPGALEEYRNAGLSYCSPLGEMGNSHVADGVAVVPFAWHHVDAYLIDPKLTALRGRNGDPEPHVSMPQWAGVLDAALAFARDRRAHVTLIFHPVVLLELPDSLPVLRDFIGKLKVADDLWVATCGDVAASLHDKPRMT